MGVLPPALNWSEPPFQLQETVWSGLARPGPVGVHRDLPDHLLDGLLKLSRHTVPSCWVLTWR